MQPSSLRRDISPPPIRKRSLCQVSGHGRNQGGTQIQRDSDLSRHEATEGDGPSLAAIEAGRANIDDHLDYFSKYFNLVSRPAALEIPRIDIEDFQNLYERNQHKDGRHFVIHQHDHPISGVHYDLRLQFSETSTISFAIPYGMPGNPNSIRPNRMAIETRVHNLWNNLIESASHATGSLLIWDTGEYEVLPYRQERRVPHTDDELSDDGEEKVEVDTRSNSERLVAEFQNKHIRLRLHGKRLPQNYTVSMRLSKTNHQKQQQSRPKHKRRRAEHQKVALRNATLTDSEDDVNTSRARKDVDDQASAITEAAAASETEEDAVIHANNAYTGASNTIGSIHQRHWFLTLDKVNSGLQKVAVGSEQGRWIGDWTSFLVMGRDHERSLVTGRVADEVMLDEGVQNFIGRKMWRPIVE